VAAVIGDESGGEWLGCVLLCLILREGESPQRQGWCAERCFDAH